MTGMFDDIRRRRADRRVKPGDGRPLKPFRWWQLLSRSLFYLPMMGEGGSGVVYAIDVRHGGDSTTGEVKAQLYLDGRQHAESKVPAFFPVPGGTIQVAASVFGLKRCHYVTADGREVLLTPDSRSAEGRRAQFDLAHPSASRSVGVVSFAVLIVGLVVLILQLVESLSQVPPIAENFGVFSSPLTLPVWANIGVGLITGAASTERALRLRYNRWLDGGAG